MSESRRGEKGFALILAIMALMLLTFLGLTLAVTTSTEMQIATNYRWSQQALFNAEAGLAIAKYYLSTIQTTGSIVWSARVAGDTTTPPWTRYRTGASGEASRNFENGGPGGCDPYGVGYGVVLDFENQAFPFQNVTTYFGQQLEGNFTVWVRRDQVVLVKNGPVTDDPLNSNIIVTSEGTAPFQVAGTAFSQSNRAVRVVQATFRLPQKWEGCSGQVGDCPEGAGGNFSQAAQSGP